MGDHSLTIAPPERIAFRYPLVIRVTDVNRGGHMGNERVLMYCQEARAALLAAMGGDEGDIHGAGVIVVDARILFMAEGFAGDVLTISVGVDDYRRSSCDFFYELVRDHDGQTIARARTRIVFFDYERRRVARMPSTFRERLPVINSQYA